MRYLALAEVLDLHRRVSEQSAAQTACASWAGMEHFVRSSDTED